MKKLPIILILLIPLLLSVIQITNYKKKTIKIKSKNKILLEKLALAGRKAFNRAAKTYEKEQQAEQQAEQLKYS